ncbi:MAG: hypothetical protein Q8Q23_03775 [bacterium]|nr:hypothetical protein [bacterium]
MATSKESESASPMLSVAELLHGVCFGLEGPEAKKTIASLTKVIEKQFPYLKKAFRLLKAKIWYLVVESQIVFLTWNLEN